MNKSNFNYFIDAHCHYDNVSTDYLKKIFENNNIISISNNIDIKSYEKLENIRKEKIKNLYFAYGLFPDNVLKKNIDECYKDLEKIDFTKAIAIGEIGLDNKITKNKIKKEEQKKLFEKQLEIAEEFKKPVIVHSRFATKKVLEILKSWNNIKIVLHWFSGTNEEINEAIERGYYLTIRYNKPKINNVIEKINQILIETDYPVNYMNLPKTILNIKESYKIFSNENKIELIKLKNTLYNNFINLFKL